MVKKCQRLYSTPWHFSWNALGWHHMFLKLLRCFPRENRHSRILARLNLNASEYWVLNVAEERQIRCLFWEDHAQFTEILQLNAKETRIQNLNSGVISGFIGSMSLRLQERVWNYRPASGLHPFPEELTMWKFVFGFFSTNKIEDTKGYVNCR